MLKMIRNPEQAKQWAMQGLQKSNPQIANILQTCMNNGESPKQILSQAIEAGQVNYNQFLQFKKIVNQYSRFLPFKIDQKEMQELEGCFNQPKQNNNFNFRF